MIYDIEISDQAEIDLRGIFEYIAFELQAPENASGQIDRLEACIMDLDHMPKRYRQYELEPWKSRGLRVAPVDNYLVLYIPDDDTQVVTIIRVMYDIRLAYCGVQMMIFRVICGGKSGFSTVSVWFLGILLSWCYH